MTEIMNSGTAKYEEWAKTNEPTGQFFHEKADAVMRPPVPSDRSDLAPLQGELLSELLPYLPEKPPSIRKRFSSCGSFEMPRRASAHPIPRFASLSQGRIR